MKNIWKFVLVLVTLAAVAACGYGIYSVANATQQVSTPIIVPTTEPTAVPTAEPTTESTAKLVIPTAAPTAESTIEPTTKLVTPTASLTATEYIATCNLFAHEVPFEAIEVLGGYVKTIGHDDVFTGYTAMNLSVVENIRYFLPVVDGKVVISGILTSKGCYDHATSPRWYCNVHHACKSVLEMSGVSYCQDESWLAGPELDAFRLCKTEDGGYEWRLAVCGCGGFDATAVPTVKPTTTPGPAHEPEATLPPKSDGTPAHEPEATLPPKGDSTVAPTAAPGVGPTLPPKEGYVSRDEQEGTTPTHSAEGSGSSYEGNTALDNALSQMGISVSSNGEVAPQHSEELKLWNVEVVSKEEQPQHSEEVLLFNESAEENEQKNQSSQEDKTVLEEKLESMGMGFAVRGKK